MTMCKTDVLLNTPAPDAIRGPGESFEVPGRARDGESWR